MPVALNMQDFWTCQGSENNSGTEYARFFNMPEYFWIIPEYAIPEYTIIDQMFTEYWNSIKEHVLHNFNNTFLWI